MQFSRVGKHTIRCVISEQEILDMGYTMEEIMSNGERTQEFVNQIFDMAEQRFETKFDRGIKTVRADFMSDHTLALTFSEHPGSDEMMEHLKDIVNGLLNSIPQQKWRAISSISLPYTSWRAAVPYLRRRQIRTSCLWEIQRLPRVV